MAVLPLDVPLEYVRLGLRFDRLERGFVDAYTGDRRLRARQQIRFLTDPLWRAYISTYVEGFDLLSRWLAARPAEQPVADRFVRLLDEPLTPRAVAAELAA
jgi:hypothetical protein